MRKPRFTVAQVAAALVKSHGLVYLTAKRLRCDAETIRNYCKRHPSLQATKEALRGEMVDLAEQKLLESIQQGEAWGITLCLKTLGKDRGYVEQQKVAFTDPSGEYGWEPTVGISALLAVARANGHSPRHAQGAIEENTVENQ
jgi:hypothetical protein